MKLNVVVVVCEQLIACMFPENIATLNRHVELGGVLCQSYV